MLGCFFAGPGTVLLPRSNSSAETFEHFREAQNHVGGKAQLVQFVVGHQLLDEAGALGDLLLCQSVFFAQTGEALSQGSLPVSTGFSFSLDFVGMVRV